jgi:nucleoside-diphosphate-sugar epimerase
MKIVILGYTGLIGNNILKDLFKKTSYDLICVGRNIKNKPHISSRVKYFKWDFTTFKKSNLSFLKRTNIIINCVGKTNSNKENLENINVIFVKKLLKHINICQFKLRLIHLSSIAVYGGARSYVGQKKFITENSTVKVNDSYSKSKLLGDLLIKDIIKKNSNKNFSYTILRISNVIGGKEKTNLYKFVMFSLKFGFWIKSSNDIMFNFVNVKDVTQAVILTLSKLKVSKNKTYIVSDDCKQYKLYKIYQNLYKKKIKKIHVPISFIKFLIYFIPLPKKFFNLLLIISSHVSYNNKKIKKELNFNPRFSILKKIKYPNEKKI